MAQPPSRGSPSPMPSEIRAPLAAFSLKPFGPRPVPAGYEVRAHPSVMPALRDLGLVESGRSRQAGRKLWSCCRPDGSCWPRPGWGGRGRLTGLRLELRRSADPTPCPACPVGGGPFEGDRSGCDTRCLFPGDHQRTAVLDPRAVLGMDAEELWRCSAQAVSLRLKRCKNRAPTPASRPHVQCQVATRRGALGDVFDGPVPHGDGFGSRAGSRPADIRPSYGKCVGGHAARSGVA